MTLDLTTARPPIPAPILESRLIAIGRGVAVDRALALAEALTAGGIRAFEATFGRGDTLGAIDALAARYGERLLVGAGTVLDREMAEDAVAAGARFLVMPHTDTALIEWAAARGIPAFPGALTPTEIVTAWRAGASAIKVFPASAVGPQFVRELRGPLPEIPLIPTGGVSVENAAAFVDAGARAVAVGSWLTGSGDPATVESRARGLVEALRPVP